MRLVIGLLASMTLVAGSAVAADSGFYVGAGAGVGSYSINENKLDNTITGALEEDPLLSVDSWGSKTDDNATTWSAFVGYRFMPYLAVEAGYLDLSGAQYKGSGTVDVTDGTSVFTGDVTTKLDWTASGWPISVLGIWPINETWDVWGRVGVFIGDVKVKGNILVDGESVIWANESSSTTEFIGGVGVDANFMERWAVRLEWEAMPSIGDKDVGGSADWNQVALSILFRL